MDPSLPDLSADTQGVQGLQANNTCSKPYIVRVMKCYFYTGDECIHVDGKSRGRVWRLWFYLISYVVYFAALHGYCSVLIMFLVSEPLCFSPALVGIRDVSRHDLVAYFCI